MTLDAAGASNFSGEDTNILEGFGDSHKMAQYRFVALLRIFRVQHVPKTQRLPIADAESRGRQLVVQSDDRRAEFFAGCQIARLRSARAKNELPGMD